MRENKVQITEKRAIMKYEYKKVTGYEQKKFVENGHTMFEEDVLQRLKRLAYLEEQMKQANGVITGAKALHIDSVMQSALPDTPDDEIYDAAAELYKVGKMLNATLLVKRHTTMNPTQAKQYCDAHFAPNGQVYEK